MTVALPETARELGFAGGSRQKATASASSPPSTCSRGSGVLEEEPELEDAGNGEPRARHAHLAAVPPLDLDVPVSIAEEPLLDEGPVPAKAAKPRLHVIDNARFFMQFLVFLGHAFTNLECPHGSHAVHHGVHAVVKLIRLVDIPVFATVSGYLSKGDQNPTRVRRTLVMLLVPWLLCDTLRKLFGYLVHEHHAQQLWSGSFLKFLESLIDGRGYKTYDIFRGYWYLGSLVVWRLSVPLMNLVKPRVLVVVSIFLSIVWPFILINERIYCSRAFEFLPFFVIGLYLPPELLVRLQKSEIRFGACCIIAAVMRGFLYFAEWTSHLDFRDGYRHHFGAPWIGPCLVKPVVLCLELGMAVCVMAVMPTGESCFSSFGTRSLYSYILHPILLDVMKHYVCVPLVPWMYLLLVGGVFLTACILMSHFVQKVFWVIVEPTWINCILQDEDKTKSRSPRLHPET